MTNIEEEARAAAEARVQEATRQNREREIHETRALSAALASRVSTPPADEAHPLDALQDGTPATRRSIENAKERQKLDAEVNVRQMKSEGVSAYTILAAVTKVYEMEVKS